MVIHKIKEIKRRIPRLLNRDGSWNIMCGSKSSSVCASENWKAVSCKLCLRKKEKKQ